ncbi:type IV secretory system conjugative DNA transfer family protein [Halopiger aswanensis]|uniref:TraM-binding TraD/TraG-like protein n=1 Tax=Halopiger aswanensis TaxID=148449 RepID=A0A3R7FWB1_9EURY|nr:type IV secretory system conjugative DNA transfer family protein [Halopiger aswanensis]RKD95638.1 TraM-binding TraD/TraG-like protein [Halopiger aswanensis]
MTPEEARKLIENSGTGTTYVGTHTSILGVEENIGIPDDKRLLHVLNTGPTGYGKTQMMVHAALQDIYKGRGVCMAVPKGEAIRQVLGKLPRSRFDDVLYLDPSIDPVPSINVLEPYITEGMTEAQKENQKEIIVSDLIDLFKRQSENWGDRFGRILETLLRAHLDLNIYQNETNSLMDVFRCVINPEQLVELIDRTENTVVREQLVRVKEDLSSYHLEPLQRRLNDFIMNSTIRRIVSSEESTVNFRDAVNQGKIILLNIQKGEVGDTVSTLIASIVVTKIWAAAQSRITQKPGERTPFYLYIDELQNFASEGSAVAKMLSEAREYRLGCWLATQYLSNLDSSTMREAVINNCRTKIAFNPLGSDNERRLLNMFTGVNKREVENLGKYRAVLQTPGEQKQRSAIIVDTYPPWDGDPQQTQELKKRRIVTGTTSPVKVEESLGRGRNAGGEKHGELLRKARNLLEERGIQVNLLYQGEGDSKPDAKVSLPNGSVAHLEAETGTLTKPAKVLKNFKRAVENDAECIFVVEQGNAAKLRSIVEDPVNRNGDKYEDEFGSYSYYTDDGDEFTDTELILDGEYRVIEISENDLTVHNNISECPELEHQSREDLEQFCLYREDDGFCTELEQRCVFK